jgi:SAM-dependent methyltransferase
MDNYEFCVHWVLTQKSGDDAIVLDYGCGAGQIVSELRKRDVGAFGCDVFYAGGDVSKMLEEKGVLGKTIMRMGENGKIPFDDATFDLVINNQVMEHVEDLDNTLSEIHRVLKPGGKVLSMFPDKGVWREGHCGIPFLHWFPKRSRPRIYYAAAFRSLGFGHYKEDKSIMRWSEDFCAWLDNWTWYRSTNEIQNTYTKYFVDNTGIEHYWLGTRLGKLNLVRALIPVPLQQMVVRKLGGRVFVCSKPGQSMQMS